MPKNFNRIIPVILTISFVLLFGCNISPTKKVESNDAYAVDYEKQILTISTFNSNGIGSIYAFDCKNEKVKPLLTDRQVMVNGRLNSNGSKLIYSDAIGNSPWDIYLLNLKNKDVQKVTNDKIGQFKACFGDITDNIIYVQAGGKDSPVPRIAKIDIKNNRSEYLTIFDDNDCAIGSFDILDSKMIILTYSYKKDVERHEEKSAKKLKGLPTMLYKIYEMNLETEELIEVVCIDAQRIETISWSADNNEAIISGAGVYNTKGAGFYKINVHEKITRQLLSENDLRKTKKIERLASPYTLCMSIDCKKIYFSAVPAGVEIVNIAGIIYYPSYLYSYDLRNNLLKEVFNEPNSFITALSTTYQ